MADVWTKNTVSGVVGLVPEEMLDHLWFSQQLVRVEEGTKDSAPELHKPKTADEHKANEATKAAAKGQPTLDGSDAVE